MKAPISSLRAAAAASPFSILGSLATAQVPGPANGPCEGVFTYQITGC